MARKPLAGPMPARHPRRSYRRVALAEAFDVLPIVREVIDVERVCEAERAALKREKKLKRILAAKKS